jgi:hypothetical protein
MHDAGCKNCKDKERSKKAKKQENKKKKKCLSSESAVFPKYIFNIFLYLKIGTITGTKNLYHVPGQKYYFIFFLGGGGQKRPKNAKNAKMRVKTLFRVTALGPPARHFRKQNLPRATSKALGHC